MPGPPGWLAFVACLDLGWPPLNGRAVSVPILSGFLRHRFRPGSSRIVSLFSAKTFLQHPSPSSGNVSVDHGSLLSHVGLEEGFLPLRQPPSPLTRQWLAQRSLSHTAFFCCCSCQAYRVPWLTSNLLIILLTATRDSSSFRQLIADFADLYFFSDNPNQWGDPDDTGALCLTVSRIVPLWMSAFSQYP
jgi:hypothetical protein